jgi:hypothetical protein
MNKFFHPYTQETTIMLCALACDNMVGPINEMIEIKEAYNRDIIRHRSGIPISPINETETPHQTGAAGVHPDPQVDQSVDGRGEAADMLDDHEISGGEHDVVRDAIREHIFGE